MGVLAAEDTLAEAVEHSDVDMEKDRAVGNLEGGIPVTDTPEACMPEERNPGAGHPAEAYTPDIVVGYIAGDSVGHTIENFGRGIAEDAVQGLGEGSFEDAAEDVVSTLR